MKKKIINITVDIILFAVVFSITDYLTLHVLQTDKLWVELCLYIVLYSIAFGAKAGILNLYNRKTRKNTEEEV